MKSLPSLIAGGSLLGAVALLQTQAAANTWNNFTANFLWSTNASDQNWTSPNAWLNGDDAIFGATGVGAVYLSTPVSAHNITVNSVGYSINALAGGNSLTLNGTTPTITVNADTTNAVSINGTSGLTVQGTGKMTLLGESAANGNHYTGGTFVKGGTLILKAAGANTSGTAYAVDSIEALDTGATVVIPAVFNGSSWVSQPRDQIAAYSGSHLKMTGGTLDLFNDHGTQRVPCPEGFGTIINTGSNASASLIINIDGDHEFSGHINDGGPLTPPGPNNQGPGNQLSINLSGGSGGTLTLSGSNSFSGGVRLASGNLKLKGAGTLGWPINNAGNLWRIYAPHYIDLNGTSQRVGQLWFVNAPSLNGYIFNSAAGTVSTLIIGSADDDFQTAINLMDNPGTGGILALTKVGTNQLGCGFFGTNTYSGDTTVSNGIMGFQAISAVSPNTNIRLFTGGGVLYLGFEGTAKVRGLYIDGVPQCPGIYGSADFPDLLPDSGLLQVTGVDCHLDYARSGNNVTFTWLGSCVKLQAQTNGITGNWSDFPGGNSSPVIVTNSPANASVFFRLTPLP